MLKRSKAARVGGGAVVGVLLLALVTALAPGGVNAASEPADKVAAAGSDLKATSADEAAIEVLSENIRVSSTSDLILQLTSECSILTSLLVEGTTEQGASSSAYSFGQVKMFVTLDEKRVPVAVDDTLLDPDDPSDSDDLGEVVFCNRAYQRTVTDTEDPQDGIDRQDDFIRTRTANAFNWLALDAGKDYDKNGDNLLKVQVWAEFDKKPAPCPDTANTTTGPIGSTCAEALIGSRTLIVEATHTSRYEIVAPAETTTTAAIRVPKL